MTAYPDFTTMPVGGQWRAGRSGKTGADNDPWSGQTLTEIPLASAEDLDEAFRAAQRAQRDWAARPPAERAQVMLAAANMMTARRTRSPAGWSARAAAPGPRPNWSGISSAP
jgi:aldehyde dehydrogenase (NAD+)